ncbi:sigma-70 family RNA polymerase sigma factor [Pseudoflavitalea sp. G-6-1-2]|uniref:sigma-70 family RNA polymerase sigma factor n=1 Tax=Pseudoflavitalea sp. G-6-1-2 TaxID=2728841 RepID=UPI00146CB5EF|nr:sigma-70 family RNA polymerase sigma factor [Pseudoflavitalea sp. G-6-1-2]NML22941.1 sigma-70 family RNA polymerase sigma factor [Pseudoflavitalea sp. G-6-1-2]
MPATLQQRPDAQTIQRFEEIYLASFPRLSLFVHRFMRNKEAARDILQDTYTTLWEQLPSIKDDNKVYPLLRTYATNLMINLIRKKAREKKREEMFYASQEVLTTTEASFDLKEAMEQYKQALDQLPLKQKQVLQLSLEEGMTHVEIAGKLNISSRTSKYLLMQARTFLRTQLQADKLAIAILLVLSGK